MLDIDSDNSAEKYYSDKKIEKLLKEFNNLSPEEVKDKVAKILTATEKRITKERILRELIKSINNTPDFNDVKQNIVTEVGKYFNASRCFIMQVDEQTMMPTDIMNGITEYRRDESVKSVFYLTKEQVECQSEYVKHAGVTNGITWFYEPDNEKFLRENNLVGTIAEELSREYNGKAWISIVLKYNNILKGGMAIHFDYMYGELDELDKEFLDDIANQAAIALHQADLYKEAQKNAHKEKLLVEISNKIRSSLDIEKTTESICKNIAEVFNVQRVFICDFPDDSTLSHEFKKEYIISKNFSPGKKPEQMWRFWRKEFQNKLISIENNIEKSDKPKYFKDYYSEIGVQSILGVKFIINEKKYGAIFLSEYTYPRKWTKEEIELLKAITNQVSYAINHASIYSDLKKKIKQENMLKHDNSIVINKNLAQNTDLNSAITYSALNNLYFANNSRKNYFTVSIENLKNYTFLSNNAQKDALNKLYECGFIYCEKIRNKNNYKISILEDNQIKLEQKLIKTSDIPKEKNNLNDKKKLKDLIPIYSNLCSPKASSVTAFYIEKNNQELSEISEYYFSVICNTFEDFLTHYEVTKEELTEIIIEWFKPPTKVNCNNILEITRKTKKLSSKLKHMLLIKLQKSELFAVDLSSKIDFTSIKIVDIEDYD